jgi:TRAP-type C4-dicarboxylate transport system permease small subunit
MTTSTASHGKSPAGGGGNAILRAWGLMVDTMSALGSVLIVVLMVIICSDVVARNLFGASLPVVAEVSALTLVMIVYLQLGAAVRHNRLARADLLLSALEQRSPRGAAALNALFQLVGALMLGLLAWSTIGILEADLARGRYVGVTGVLTVPTWPFRAVILFGISVAALESLVQLGRVLFGRSEPHAS